MNRFSTFSFGFIALLAISCAAQQIPTPFFHAVDTATAVRTLPNFSPDPAYNLLRAKDSTMLFYYRSWQEYVTKPASAKGFSWLKNVGPGIFTIGPQDTFFVKGSGVTLTRTGTDTLLMTVTGSGDITDVGPAFSSGAAFTDGAVSTGTTMLIWEGTSDDANELSILSPTANPASDINITLPSATSILVGNSTAILDAAGLGLTVTGTTLVFSATELGNTTWLDNNDRTFTFDIAGAGTNPTIGFSSALFTMTGSLDLKNSGAPGALAIYENSGVGTDKVTIQAPADITASYSLNLPVAQGGANTFLQNDGSGSLSWATAGTGDITAVGPAFSSGDAFVDGTASTGTLMLVWEGTTVNTAEFNLYAPSANPGADIDITFPASTATLATIALTETLTNKTLTSPILTTPSISGTASFTNTSAAALFRLYENDLAGTDYITVQAPNDITATYTLTLPLAQGGASTFLQNDGSGNLSWASETGDISAVTAGNGLTGGGSSGAVTLDVNPKLSGVGRLIITSDSLLVHADAIDSTRIIAGTVAGSDIANSAIINAKIANAAVDSNKTVNLTFADIVSSPSSRLASVISNETGSGLLVFGTSPTLNGTNVNIGGGTSATELRFLEPSGSGSNYTAFVAQAQTGNVTYTFPAADGSSGNFLSTNGSGTLSWAAGGSGDITSVGDVASGAAFDGTQGTILTFNNAGGDGTFQYDGSNFLLSHGISTSLQHAFLVKPYNTGAGNTGQVEFWELAANGTNSINVKAPDAITSDRTVTWPDAAGEISLLGQSIDLSGSEATGTLAAARFGTLTGDVTTAGGSYATTIADNSVDGTDIALGSDAQGDVMYYDGTNWARLGAGNAGEYLQTQGAAANPIWAAVSAAGDITAVGPFASGDAFVDGTASSGTDMLIWEGTAVNAFELRLKSPTNNPASDIDITLPSATATLATIALTETLTNKTLTSPIISTPSISGIASYTNTSNPAIIRLYESDLAGTDYVEIQAPNDATATYTLVLPVAQGGASTFLQNNGSGVLSWASAITSLTAGNYIDVSGSTIHFDPTEIGSGVTWNDGTLNTIQWNFNLSGANDPDIQFSNTGPAVIFSHWVGWDRGNFYLEPVSATSAKIRASTAATATLTLYNADGSNVLDLSVEGAITEGGNAVANATDKLSFFAATTSSELAGVLSDETGSSGGFVRATSPTITTPTISGDLNAIVIEGANSKTLTESSATSFVRIDVSADSFVGGQVFYTVYATDGADYQVRTGSFNFSIYNTSGVDDEYITIGTVINEAYVASTGTLTVSFTGDTSPTNGVNLQANATASIGQSTLQIKYRVMISSGTATVTGL